MEMVVESMDDTCSVVDVTTAVVRITEAVHVVTTHLVQKEVHSPEVSMVVVTSTVVVTSSRFRHASLLGLSCARHVDPMYLVDV